MTYSQVLLREQQLPPAEPQRAAEVPRRVAEHSGRTRPDYGGARNSPLALQTEGGGP